VYLVGREQSRCHEHGSAVVRIIAGVVHEDFARRHRGVCGRGGTAENVALTIP
jgi:hypothetical protein